MVSLSFSYPSAVTGESPFPFFPINIEMVLATVVAISRFVWGIAAAVFKQAHLRENLGGDGFLC